MSDNSQYQLKRKPQRLELTVLLPNVLLIGLVVFFFLITRVGEERVEPLVAANPKLSEQITQLEQSLSRNPQDVGRALELAQLYQDVGEFPWSYDALKNAEETGGEEPGWRLRLGLAYLNLGKNKDAHRVLTGALKKCQQETCPAGIQVKLETFSRLVDLFIQRGIDSRRHRSAAEAAMREILKPVHVDPQKMGSKGPAPRPGEPSPPPAANPQSGPQAVPGSAAGSAPAAAPPQAAAQSPAGAPSQAAAQSPAAAPSQAAALSPAGAPSQAAAQSPARAPSQTGAKTPAAAPSPATPESPAAAPSPETAQAR